MSSGSCASAPSSRPWAKYVVHCRSKFQYDVYIGRGSIYGNPFTHLDLQSTKATFKVETREGAILSYRLWLVGDWEGLKFLLKDPRLLEKAKLLRRPSVAEIQDLRRKILGCFCSPMECHGEILAEFANGTPITL